MSAKFTKGDKVRQVMPAPVEGVVVGFVLDEEDGSISYIVQNKDKDGHINSRSFSADQIEVVG